MKIPLAVVVFCAAFATLVAGAAHSRAELQRDRQSTPPIHFVTPHL